MKNLKIIDTHFHIWEREFFAIEWIKNSEFDRNFTFKDYVKSYKDLNFYGGIYIEVDSTQKEKELAYIQNLARQKDQILGICIPQETFFSKQKSPKTCAIRKIMHKEIPCEEEILQSIEKIYKENTKIVFEACLLEKDLLLLEKIATKFPKLKIVINHFGNPDFNDLESYTHKIKTLAKIANIYCKLSPCDSFDIQIAEQNLDKILKIIFSYFPVEKLLFGSNYPVSKIPPYLWVKILYTKLLNLHISHENIQKIFTKNAMECYEILPKKQRFSQITKIKQDMLETYKNLHYNAWKEINDTLKKAHIQNYSIYHYGDYLFAYFEYTGEDFSKDMQQIAQDSFTQKWWIQTDACQIPMGENSPWLDITEVFHLD
ncbi:L-rhamnose mutarotase [Helicobacter anatolicus]|uniref:L-rhamnose mutarotase n=1 Tax=Helicobacter anatolicus TaxID=2905874 RepID=UPI001E576E42|nr:L-rhamnose mutarotase [Helicobacter anatolicus]MCE3037909.1 L-rhamnose mutarotase [Helicobacter anatolicus]